MDTPPKRNNRKKTITILVSLAALLLIVGLFIPFPMNSKDREIVQAVLEEFMSPSEEIYLETLTTSPLDIHRLYYQADFSTKSPSVQEATKYRYVLYRQSVPPVTYNVQGQQKTTKRIGDAPEDESKESIVVRASPVLTLSRGEKAVIVYIYSRPLAEGETLFILKHNGTKWEIIDSCPFWMS